MTAVKSSTNTFVSIWARREYTTLCFHYLLPEVDWHNRVFFAIEAMARRPILIADAGFMYVAKMSGLADQYDLFTPDVGELAFLADEEAPHPFYTRGFILHEDNLAPDLIKRAYAFDNAARYLLVKGKIDYIAAREGILAAVTEPDLEVLEPIGGTGDTITGLVAALIDCRQAHPRGGRDRGPGQPVGRAVCQPHPGHPGGGYYRPYPPGACDRPGPKGIC